MRKVQKDIVRIAGMLLDACHDYYHHGRTCNGCPMRRIDPQPGETVCEIHIPMSYGPRARDIIAKQREEMPRRNTSE